MQIIKLRDFVNGSFEIPDECIEPDKTETINFRKFMDGSFREKSHTPLLAFSVVPPVLTDLEPMVHVAYIVISVLGVLTIGGAIAEKKLMKKEMYHMAQKTMNFVKVIVPIIGYGVILWCLFNNPFMRWL